MSTRVAAALVTLILVASVFALAEMSAPPPPAVQFVGHDSKIATQRYELIRHEDAWAKLWNEHTGRANSPVPPHRHFAPKIDFARFMVVAYFAGTSTNVDGEPAVHVLDTDDAVTVRFEPSTFQTASSLNGGQDRGVQTTPFGIWVIERSDKTILIEEGRRGLKNEQPTWTVVKRFERN